MSDVEKMWVALAAKWGQPLPPWHQLDPAHQMMLMQSFNTIAQIAHAYKVQQ